MTAYGTWFESCMALYIGDILWDRLPGLTDHHNRQETVLVSKDIIIWNIYASAFPYFLHALRTTINFLIWPALHWILTGIMLLYNCTLIKGGCTCSIPVRRMMLWILRGERGRSIWFCTEGFVWIVEWELGFAGWALGHSTEGSSILSAGYTDFEYAACPYKSVHF